MLTPEAEFTRGEFGRIFNQQQPAIDTAGVPRCVPRTRQRLSARCRRFAYRISCRCWTSNAVILGADPGGIVSQLRVTFLRLMTSSCAIAPRDRGKRPEVERQGACFHQDLDDQRRLRVR